MNAELTAPKMSLYQIEDTLVALDAERRQAIEDGDADAEQAIDKAISEYLTKEAAKVTSYVGLIRSREATVAAATAELDRITAIRDAAKRDIERLKSTAMGVMNRFGVRELKATPGGGLRIQANGGSQPLELQNSLLPESAVTYAVAMSSECFAAIPEQIRGRQDFLTERTPHQGRIRAALKQRVTCPECKGRKLFASADDDHGHNTEWHDCERCKGEGTIHATVPGAKLLERGEHVRVL